MINTVKPIMFPDKHELFKSALLNLTYKTGNIVRTPVNCKFNADCSWIV